MGDCEVIASAVMESTFGYHPFVAGILTVSLKQVNGQCQVGSLTGAVAS